MSLALDILAAVLSVAIWVAFGVALCLLFMRRDCSLCGRRRGEGPLFDSMLLRAITIYRAEDKPGNQPDLRDVKRRAGFPVEAA